MIRAAAAADPRPRAQPAAALATPSTTDPAKVPAGSYVLDKQHASLTVKIVHMGFSHYTMRFDGLDGSFTYDPANWQSTKATFTVDPKSIDTNDSAFNKQIAGYFEADKYPDHHLRLDRPYRRRGRQGDGDRRPDLSWGHQAGDARRDLCRRGPRRRPDRHATGVFRLDAD